MQTDTLTIMSQLVYNLLHALTRPKKNVKIVKQMEDGRVIDVAILGKGDYFGELALINHKPRAASVYASK